MSRVSDTTLAAAEIRIDIDDAIRLLREVVKAHGFGVIYEIPEWTDGCVYVDHGQCSCLIGRVLAAAGVPITVLEEHNSETVLDIQLPGVFISTAARRVLSIAQYEQDTGERWGYALTRAEQRYTELGGVR